jgi:hypothetical protein
VVVYLIKPSTEYEGRCRFARHPIAMAYSGQADVMMSHYWDGSWGTLIACAAQGSSMGRYIWICALANRCVLSWCALRIFVVVGSRSTHKNSCFVFL